MKNIKNIYLSLNKTFWKHINVSLSNLQKCSNKQKCSRHANEIHITLSTDTLNRLLKITLIFSFSTPKLHWTCFDPCCRNMLINLKGQVRSGLDRDGISNWPQTRRNICSLCVTQSGPLWASRGPQEPGNGSKSRPATIAQMLSGHGNSLSSLREAVKLVNEIFLQFMILFL